MIPDSLFSPSQSPCFSFSKSLFLLPLSPFFVLSKSRSRPLRPLPSSFVLSHPPRFPFQSSPLILLQAKENSGTTRIRPAVLQEIPQSALGIVLCATDGFFNPIVDFQTFLLTKFVYLKTLVLYCLFVTAYANVTVNHSGVFIFLLYSPPRRFLGSSF